MKLPEKKLRIILERFCQKRLQQQELTDIIHQWINDVVEHMKTLHYVDDERMAQAIIQRSHEKGVGY